MTINVEGVLIELTKEQVAKIQEVRDKRKQCRKSFHAMLIHFGFKKKDEDSYTHVYYNWYAEILNHGAWLDLWLIGEGLKNTNSFPGGWIYSTPEELEKEIVKFQKAQK